MFSLENLLVLILAAVAASYWLRSGEYKGRARELAMSHCRELNLQFLDYSMVIVGFRPVRDAGRFAFRRSYQFEFASAGDRRYTGRLVLIGMTLKSIELETYRLPESD